jgi:proton-dependent oligopeptide transporter, POT family
MSNRTSFPKVFWIANSIEVIERFAFYGIYMGFGIYAINHLHFNEDQLGHIQQYFLAIAYLVPLFSGTLADRYGFKKLLIVAYLAYLPSILLLLIANTYNEVALTMLSIGLAAGIFKPLVAGTVRTVTDASNKTLGFGIFYTMVNIGGTFGPIVAGKLRAISWYYAYILAAIGICTMLLITIFFYKEPKREPSTDTLGKKLKEILEVMLNLRFSVFLIILGLFFWMPFWSFFNLGGIYVDGYLDKAYLYDKLHSGIGFFARMFGNLDNGTWKINGEAIANSGIFIILFQVVISKFIEKRDAILSFLTGMVLAIIGFVLIGYAFTGNPAWAFLGIAFFAFGEMISSPRIQEYIMWLAPKEKAGMYMGASFIATFIGAWFSGYYTSLIGSLKDPQNIIHIKICHLFHLSGETIIPNFVWYVLAIHLAIGILVILGYVKLVGSFKERSE